MLHHTISSNTQQKIKDELQAHAEGVATNHGKDLDEWTFVDLHHAAFNFVNEDYYIIGYHNASEWLKRHKVDELQALNFVQEWEKEHFGESRQYDNSEALVSMIAYILGYEVIVDALQALKDDREFSARWQAGSSRPWSA